MEVSFFMPEQYLPDPARREAWKSGAPLVLDQSGKSATVHCWIYQTWLRLSEMGYPAKLVHEMPASGIVVALTGNLARDFRPKEGVYLLGIVADGMPHPGAQLQVVQNAAYARRLADSVYMPHWTQPNLLPRDPARGDLFENVHFFGDPKNLAPELATRDFQETCKSRLGLSFETRGAEHWHDYRSTDCSLAIRGFGKLRYDFKPPTKLANAWLAEVPFVGGGDTAYSTEGHPEKDYIACKNPEDVLAALARLKANSELRRNLVEAGKSGARRHEGRAITLRWMELLEEEAKPRFLKWQKKSAVDRRLFFLKVQARLRVHRALLR